MGGDFSLARPGGIRSVVAESREVFATNAPVRATTQADLMLRGGLVEISAIAGRADVPWRYINLLAS